MKIEERGLKDEVDLRKQYFSLHFSAFAISITRRLRLLAWPIWADAPFGPGPPRSAFSSASTVILPSLAYCCWKPTRKPMTVDAVLGLGWVRAAERKSGPYRSTNHPERHGSSP